MPKWTDIPEKYKAWSNKHNQLIALWFFKGVPQAQINKMKAREGICGQKALRAIFSILKSFEPKHEHKMAACAYLLDEWFEIEGMEDEQQN